jgi:hypothetical protein
LGEIFKLDHGMKGEYMNICSDIVYFASFGMSRLE